MSINYYVLVSNKYFMDIIRIILNINKALKWIKNLTLLLLGTGYKSDWG